MIIWKSKQIPAELHSIKAGVLMFRYTIRFSFLNDKDQLGFEFGYFDEYFNKSSNEWIVNDSATNTKYMILNIKEWNWGQEHFYYDGPHCSISFGWINFYWNNWNCKRCFSDE